MLGRGFLWERVGGVAIFMGGEAYLRVGNGLVLIFTDLEYQRGGGFS